MERLIDMAKELALSAKDPESKLHLMRNRQSMLKETPLCQNLSELVKMPVGENESLIVNVGENETTEVAETTPALGETDPATDNDADALTAEDISESQNGPRHSGHGVEEPCHSEHGVEDPRHSGHGVEDPRHSEHGVEGPRHSGHGVSDNEKLDPDENNNATPGVQRPPLEAPAW